MRLPARFESVDPVSPQVSAQLFEHLLESPIHRFGIGGSALRQGLHCFRAGVSCGDKLPIFIRQSPQGRGERGADAPLGHLSLLFRDGVDKRLGQPVLKSFVGNQARLGHSVERGGQGLGILAREI